MICYNPSNEYPRQELSELGALYDDTNNRYLREGKAESVIMLMEKKGLSIDEAVDPAASSDYMRGAVFEIVKFRLHGC